MAYFDVSAHVSSLSLQPNTLENSLLTPEQKKLFQNIIIAVVTMEVEISIK
jgi:hypothetical protein